jgi:hypothetical protein
MLQDPPERLRTACAPLTPIRFNDLFCLQRPEIQTISVGAAEVSDFDEHLRALSLLEDHAVVRSIYRKWEQLMEEAAGSVRPDALWQPFPGWQETPGYINIGMVLWLYNLARGWNLLEFARRRYRMLGREMPWMPGLNGTAARQYDLANIAEKAGMSAEELTETLEQAHVLLGQADGKGCQE